MKLTTMRIARVSSEVVVLSTLLCAGVCSSFFPHIVYQKGPRRYPPFSIRRPLASSEQTVVRTTEEATEILAQWDRYFNNENTALATEPHMEDLRRLLPDAIRLLSQAADDERSQDPTKGRCMLGICASSPEQGVATLKAWVTSLTLPRGLLHGMDNDGAPVELEGGVYIKYNTGGALTFEYIRRSGLGFDALWKPGDALVEMYDGKYRGVYFQVELSDNVFRQFFLPLDTFGGVGM